MSNAAVKKDSQEGWQFLPIKDFAHTTSGGTPKRSVAEYYNGDVPWVKSGDLNDGHLNKVDEYITKLGLEKSSAKLFKPGTLLIALYGATIGRLSILNFEASTNQAICGITVPDGVQVKYLFYYLLSIRQKLIDQGKGGAQPNINQQIVKETMVPLAPPEQQKRIVAKIEELFSHIDAGIEALKKAKQLLKQYRQSVLKAAVTGELTKEWREANKGKLEPASQLLERIDIERGQEFKRKLVDWEDEFSEWKSKGENGKKPSRPKRSKTIESISEEEAKALGELPNGWIWLRLGNLAVDVFDGPFGSNLKSSDYVEEGIRVIRLENIGNLEFKDEKESFVTPEKYESLKKHTVGSGDLIFSSFVADGTRVVVLPKQIEKAINKADCFCVRCFGSSVYNYYLASFLATNTAYKRLENEVHGATRPRINTSQLKYIEIPICPIEEQKEAVRILGLKFDAIERIDGEIGEKLLMVDKNKQSILADAFLGNLVPAKPNDEDAGELLSRTKQPKPEGAKVRKAESILGKQSRVKYMNDLLRVLTDHADWISAKDAFLKCGISDNAEIEQVERVYSELRDLVIGGAPKVEIERRGDEDWLRIKDFVSG